MLNPKPLCSGTRAAQPELLCFGAQALPWAFRIGAAASFCDCAATALRTRAASTFSRFCVAAAAAHSCRDMVAGKGARVGWGGHRGSI